MSSNLPPGCRVSDIPGNRPEDLRWESIIETFWNKKRTPQKDRILRIASTNLTELIDEAIEYGLEIAQHESHEAYKENKGIEKMYIDGIMLESTTAQEKLDKVLKMFGYKAD